MPPLGAGLRWVTVEVITIRKCEIVFRGGRCGSVVPFRFEFFFVFFATIRVCPSACVHQLSEYAVNRAPRPFHPPLPKALTLTHTHTHWAQLQKANLDTTIYQHNNHSSPFVSFSAERSLLQQECVSLVLSQRNNFLVSATPTLKTMTMDDVQCVLLLLTSRQIKYQSTGSWEENPDIFWTSERRKGKKKKSKFVIEFFKSIYSALLVSVEMQHK